MKDELTGTTYLLTRDVLWDVAGRSVSLMLGAVAKERPFPTPNCPTELCALRIVRGVIVDAESDSKLPPSSLSYDSSILLGRRTAQRTRRILFFILLLLEIKIGVDMHRCARVYYSVRETI